ncbi:MAG: DUF1801 domain-containing protein [Candidatus Heimdallarchaeota archaeon]|nr:DUF1801 domain-containing protein [Candidatus Heimdallarchaeota archaeon]
MVKSNADTVEQYLDELPDDRKQAMAVVREIILEQLPDGYEETMQWGMISYVIPLKIFPDTYNKLPLGYVSLASQKNYMTVYLNNIYSSKEATEWFYSEYDKSGKKIDMGKSCVRFKKLEDLPLQLIGQAIAKDSVENFLKLYKDAQKMAKRSKK